MSKSNRRRISITVSSQTLYHLQVMANFSGIKDLGRVIDKLVRDKQIQLNESTKGAAPRGGSSCRR